MTEQQGLTFQQAARELRAIAKKSQPNMAAFLGLSTPALRKYESGSTTAPDARACVAYMMTAELSGRPDLVQIFGSALRRVMGIEAPSLVEWMRNPPAQKKLLMEPVNYFEERMTRALLACIRGQGPFKKYQNSVLQTLAMPSYEVDLLRESLQFLPREELEEQLATFDKVAIVKPEPEKEENGG
jgi:hypothetical protein